MKSTVPVAMPECPRALRSELDRLPREALVVAERGVRVFVTEAHRIPTVMRQVGRERERTYREAGEGTGRDRDLDRFDDHYLQLVSWDDRTDTLVGGYRLGLVGSIARSQGPSGLASTATFEVEPRLLTSLERAIELGRSFVVPEHQRSFSALPLLWQGIGAVIDRHERVRLLLGAVSVPATYSVESRRRIAAFLLSRHRRSPWASAVRARHPFAPSAVVPTELREMEADVFARDGRKPPILVKHYLQLGMRGLASGSDPDFGECLDVLCVADLRDAPTSLLGRFMGPAGAARFASRHLSRSLAA